MQKNIPSLRFPEFKDEWEEKKLFDIGEFKNGINKSKEDFGFGVPFVNLMDVFGKSVISDLKLDLVNANSKEIENYSLKKGDVLFIRSSVKKEGVGETSLLIKDLEKTVFSGFLIRFRDGKVKLDLNYKKYCFSNRNFREKLISLSSTSANTNINQESLNSLELFLPQILEQQKIAVFLLSTDDWVSNLKKQKGSLENYKKGMMQKIFSQEIRFKDENGKGFTEWKEMKLQDISYITTGSSNRQDSTDKGDYVFFDRSIDIRASSKYLFDNEAIIIAGEGQEFNPKYFVGKFDLHQRTYAIMNFKECVGKFMFYYLDKNKKYFNKVAVGSTVPSLRLPMFNKMSVLIPEINEQQKITEFLTSVDKVIESKQQQIALAESWKKGLMQRMFI